MEKLLVTVEGWLLVAHAE
jgi:hypothetical protein